MTLPDTLQQFLKSTVQSLRSIHYHWYLLVGLLLLSILGVGITDASERLSHWYWLGMVPIFFGACMYVEWDATKGSGATVHSVILKQVMHWSGLLMAVYLTFFLRNIGSLDNQTTGLILLLLFAITTFLAGVTMGWLFRLLGIFLGLCLYLVAYMEHYLQVIIWIAVGILIVYHFLLRYYAYYRKD